MWFYCINYRDVQAMVYVDVVRINRIIIYQDTKYIYYALL